MSKRVITAKQRAWLLDELNVWRRDAIVSDEQSRRITDLYEGAGELAERGRSRAVFTLMAAAATLVGLAALLLIGYNWDQLDRLTKLAMVLGTIAVTHAIGFSLRYGRNARAGSEAVFFLGCLFYGAGIWLVAQVFHINAHYPDGLWWWAVGVLPFALCLETRLLHALVVGILAVWVGQEILNFSYLGGWFFGRWNAHPQRRVQPAAPGVAGNGVGVSEGFGANLEHVRPAAGLVGRAPGDSPGSWDRTRSTSWARSARCSW